MFRAIFTYQFLRSFTDIEVLVFQLLIVTTANGYAFNNCDYYVRLNPNEGKSVVNPGGYVSIYGFFGYYGFFDPGSAYVFQIFLMEFFFFYLLIVSLSSCRYFIEGPRNYVIQMYCQLNIAITVSFICEKNCLNVILIKNSFFVYFVGLGRGQFMQN